MKNKQSSAEKRAWNKKSPAEKRAWMALARAASKVKKIMDRRALARRKARAVLAETRS